MERKSKAGTRNTGGKQAKSRRGANLAEAGKATQFVKGYDPRRNLKGRPKTFDAFRALAQDIAEQVATTRDGRPIKWNGQEITYAEFILLSWVTDKKYLEKFVEAAFGKIPQSVDVTSNGEPLIDESGVYDRILARIQKRMADNAAGGPAGAPEQHEP